MPPSQTEEWIESRIPQHKFILQEICISNRFSWTTLCNMYICQNSFRICKTSWFASLLTSSLPACILCSTAIASLLFCSAMLPTTCQTVPPSWCHTCVGADSGGMQSPAGRQALGQVPTSPPAPSHPRLQPCVQTSGKAHSHLPQQHKGFQCKLPERTSV